MTGISNPTISPVCLAKFPEQEIICSHSIDPLSVSTTQPIFVCLMPTTEVFL